MRAPLLLFTLFAALGVMSRELPECVRLCDDVANDDAGPTRIQEGLLARIPDVRTLHSTALIQVAAPICRAPSDLTASTMDASRWCTARTGLLFSGVQRK